MSTKRILALVLSFVLMFPAVWADTSLALETQAEEVRTNEAYSYLGYNEDKMLPYETRWLSNWIHYYWEDAEHPDGQDIDLPVVRIEISEQYIWGENGERVPAEEGFFYLDGNSENGWNLYTENYGSADLKLYYEDPDGKLASYEFTVFSVNEIYYLNWDFLNATNRYLKNFDAPVYALLTKNYRNEEDGNNYYDQVVEDFTIDFEGGSMTKFENDCLTAAIGEDKKSLDVVTKDTEGWTSLFIVAEVPEKGVVTVIDVAIGVFGQFVNILPYELDNPGLGGTVDFSDVAAYLFEGNDTKGTDITDNEDIRMFVGRYDENVFEPQTELTQDSVPNFTRISTDGGSILVVVEENVAADGEDEDWRFVAQRWFNFGWLDYHVWFDDLQNGDHGYVYVGENEVFSINTDNLQDKSNCDIHFEVGINVDDEFVPFETQDGLFEVLTRKGQIIGLELNGDALNELRDQMRDDGWFDICAIVSVDGQEVARDWRGMQLREAWVDYHYDNWGMSMLPYWDHGIGKNLGYHLNDVSNPDGTEGEVQITDIRVDIIDGNDDILEVIEWEDGNGWNLHANDFGHAVVTLTHPSVSNSDEEVEHSFDVWIGEDVWNLSVAMTLGTGDILPGQTKDVRADITHERFTYEEGHYKGDTEHVAYRWGYCENNPEHLLTMEEEGNVLHITANEDAENGANTRIWVRAYMTDEEGNIVTDENGNDIEVAYADFEIGIRGEFPTILPAELDSAVELGETIDLEPELIFVSDEGVRGVEDAVFKYEWDPSEIELRLENGQELEMEDGRSPFVSETIKAKKLQPWNVGVKIYAYVKNDNGDYEEVFQRWIETGEVSYDFWLEKDRGDEGFTFLFADETEYKIPLNTDAMEKEDGSLKDNISIEWTVGERNPAGEFVRECTLGKEYTLNEDKTEITLNGEKLKENGFEIRLMMEVVVKSNGMPVFEEPYCVNFWIQEDILELEDDSAGDTLPIWGWFYENDSMNGFVRNSTYPDGEHITFEIRNIETHKNDDGEGEVLEVLHDRDGKWEVNPLRCGEADVIYTLYHESCGEIQVTRTKWVTNELYSMGLVSNTHSWQMLTNDELEMNISVHQYTMTEDGGYDVQQLPRDRYDLRFEYNPDLITILEDGKVSSHDWYDTTGVYVEANVQMLDGESIYTTGNSVEISVTPEYEKLCARPLYMEPEGVINVEEIDIYRLYVTEDNREGERLEVDGFELYPPAHYLEYSEDGKTLKLVYEIPEEELPITFGMEYEAFYDNESRWDYMDVIVCRHDMTEWFVEEEPTNIEDGLEIRWCQNCGMVEERIMESPKLAVTDVFSDVYDDWYAPYVQYVYDYRLMTGIKGTTRFEPNSNITKAQVAQVLYNMEGQPEIDLGSAKAFKELRDVFDYEWYANAVAWAYENGVVTGDLNAKKFSPDADVTREQLALMMYRYAKYKDYDVSATSDFAGLANADKIADWSLDGMKWAVGEGLISGAEVNGVKDLSPQGSAQRAQVAAILMRFCQKHEN